MLQKYKEGPDGFVVLMQPGDIHEALSLWMAGNNQSVKIESGYQREVRFQIGAEREPLVPRQKRRAQREKRRRLRLQDLRQSRRGPFPLKRPIVGTSTLSRKPGDATTSRTSPARAEPRRETRAMSSSE